MLTAVILYMSVLVLVGSWRSRARQDGRRLSGGRPDAAGACAGLHAAGDLDRVGEPVWRGGARLPIRLRRALAVRRRLGRHCPGLLHRAARQATRALHGGPTSSSCATAPPRACSGRSRRCSRIRRLPPISSGGGGRLLALIADVDPGTGALLTAVFCILFTLACRHVVHCLPRRRQRPLDDVRGHARRRVSHRRCRRHHGGASGAQARPGLRVRRHRSAGGVRALPAHDVPAARRSQHVSRSFSQRATSGPRASRSSAGSPVRSWSRR